jgi:ABC-type bacteriocin/lantibiotic exporter with double-glycine peptidase domain
MLDETLSSLDQQAVENVLEHIQKEHRLIIIVAHQASSGLFDHHLQI